MVLKKKKIVENLRGLISPSGLKCEDLTDLTSIDKSK